MLHEHRMWVRVGAHPNIVRLDLCFVDEPLALVMERCDATLESLIQAGSIAGDHSRCACLLRDMLSAIAHVHSRDVVHRDIKFANFLLVGSTVKLGDFGLAMVMPSCGYLTHAAGTPAFMAPEVASHRRYGKSADIWSCGVCWYCMSFGDAPYKPLPGEKGSGAWRQAVAQGPPPSFQARTGCPTPPLVATELAQGMLSRLPLLRPSAESALRLNFLHARVVQLNTKTEFETLGCEVEIKPSEDSQSTMDDASSGHHEA